MDSKCNVVLAGTIIDGFNYSIVIEQLSTLFKIDKQKAAALLDSKMHIIKKNIDRVTAEKYKRAFQQIGVSCDIEMVRAIKIDIGLPPELKMQSPSTFVPSPQSSVSNTNPYCSTCGAKLPQEANYCHVCGESVHKRVQESTNLSTEFNTHSIHAQNNKISSNSQRVDPPQAVKLGFWEVALLPFKNYATFEGRSRRKEYWSFFLLASLGQFCISFTFGFIQGFLVSVTHGRTGYGISQWGDVLSFFFGLGIIIPMIAVGVRRLHDTNRSGWWLLFPIVNFVFLALDGDKSANKFGPPIVK